jgi:DtxR family Mn-dependent transcriptional regulator
MPELSDLTQSKSVQDFLKVVYSLQPQVEEWVSTNALADALKISAPSVTDMAQRLAAGGLVTYKKYSGVRLTEEGEMLALKIVRRHRLIELYLVEELGYALHEVHAEAENLEHAVSDRFIEAVAHKLDNPDFDPHGDPIPNAEGQVVPRDLHPLSEWPVRTTGLVSRFKTDNQDMLQHILDRGFKLDSKVEVLERDPFDGPITTLVDGKKRTVGHNVAACILVQAREE